MCGEVWSEVIGVAWPSRNRDYAADLAIASFATAMQAFISSMGFSGLASYSRASEPSAGNLISRRALKRPTTSSFPLPMTTFLLPRAEFHVVLDVGPEDAGAESLDGFDRVFAAAEEVAAIDAGPDPLVPPLHRLHHAVDAVVELARAVIVDGDPDVVLGDQLVQAVEGVLRPGWP